MMKNPLLAASVCSALLFSCGAIAAQPDDSGMYVYVAGGASKLGLNRGEVDTILKTLGATGVSSAVERSDAGYKLQAGYMFNRYVGIEGGWVDLGRFLYNATFTGGSLRTDFNVNGGNISGIGVWPLADRFSLFARAGAMYAKTTTTVGSRVGTTAFASTPSDERWIANVGAGATFDVTRNIAVRAEAELYRYAGNPISTGQGDIQLYSFGLKYSFR